MSFDTDSGRWERVMVALRYISISRYTGSFKFSMTDGRIRRGTVDALEKEVQLLKQREGSVLCRLK